MSGIEVFALCKSFGEKRLFQNLSFKIEEGGRTAIMAASGWGKTTLLRILMGLEKADSGKVAGIAEKKISASFQEDRLCENLSAAQNIRVACPRLEREKIEGALTRLGLKSDSPARSLSAGMRRRASLARALLVESEIVFLDEPFNFLDAETKKLAVCECRKMSEGKTLIFVTHDAAEAQAMDATLLSFPMEK